MAHLIALLLSLTLVGITLKNGCGNAGHPHSLAASDAAASAGTTQRGYLSPEALSRPHRPAPSLRIGACFWITSQSEAALCFWAVIALARSPTARS